MSSANPTTVRSSLLGSSRLKNEPRYKQLWMTFASLREVAKGLSGDLCHELANVTREVEWPGWCKEAVEACRKAADDDFGIEVAFSAIRNAEPQTVSDFKLLCDELTAAWKSMEDKPGSAAEKTAKVLAALTAEVVAKMQRFKGAPFLAQSIEWAVDMGLIFDVKHFDFEVNRERIPEMLQDPEQMQEVIKLASNLLVVNPDAASKLWDAVKQHPGVRGPQFAAAMKKFEECLERQIGFSDMWRLDPELKKEFYDKWENMLTQLDRQEADRQETNSGCTVS